MLDDTMAKAEGQMNRDFPPGIDEGDSHIRLSDVDDEHLLAGFRKVQEAADSPLPQSYVALAKGSFALRTAHAELATLIEESELVGTASVTRGKERLAVFDSEHLSVEVVVSPRPRARSWQLLGQITPAKAARVRVRRQQQAEQASVTADDLGRFVLDQLTSGPLSLSIEVNGEPPVSTEWMIIGPKDLGSPGTGSHIELNSNRTGETREHLTTSLLAELATLCTNRIAQQRAIYGA